MDIIRNSIEVFERLRELTFTIEIEDGTVFKMEFQPENYHHLAGFQHLTDLKKIIGNPQNKRRFYSDIASRKIPYETIYRSSKFSEVEQRLNHFFEIEEILATSEQKIIVNFDESILSTSINAEYILFKRDSEELSLRNELYRLLFIGKRSSNYFPATYIIENSKMYITNQETLYCKIAAEQKK